MAAESMRRRLEFVVGGEVKRRSFLVFSDATLEEVLFLLDVHHFSEPGQWVLDAAGEGSETAALEATVRDKVDVGEELFNRKADGVNGQAVANEFLFQGDRFAHEAAQLFLE